MEIRYLLSKQLVLFHSIPVVNILQGKAHNEQRLCRVDKRFSKKLCISVGGVDDQ
jgi:hypothetical protein